MLTSINIDLESRWMNAPDDPGIQRAAAVKTAWLLAIVALLIFVAFVLSGVVNH